MRAFICLSFVLVLAGCKTKEEQIVAEKEKGQFLAEKKAALVEGIGKGLQGGGKDGVESLSKGVGDVLKGAAQGFDASLNAVNVQADEGLAAKGIAVPRASHNDPKDDKENKVVAAYVTFDQAFEGKLQLRAMDGEKKEVGRASVDAKEEAGSARYIDFAFDARTPVKTADHFVLLAF